MVRVEDSWVLFLASHRLLSSCFPCPSAFQLLCSLPPSHAAWEPTQGAQSISANQHHCCRAWPPHCSPAAGQAQLPPSTLQQDTSSHQEQRQGHPSYKRSEPAGQRTEPPVPQPRQSPQPIGAEQHGSRAVACALFCLSSPSKQTDPSQRAQMWLRCFRQNIPNTKLQPKADAAHRKFCPELTAVMSK